MAEAIREKGLAGAQIGDIVRHAHASRSTFYRCFVDKNACFAALAESMLDEMRIKVARAVDPNAPPETQVDQSIEAFLALVQEDRAVTVTLSTDLQSIGRQGAELRAQSIERYAEFVMALVHNPHVEKTMGPLEHVTIEKAVMLICGIEGLLDRAQRRGDDFTKLAPEVKAVVKRVLAPT